MSKTGWDSFPPDILYYEPSEDVGHMIGG